MKHLKSSLADMRTLFGRSVNARHLAEPLVSFDSTSAAKTVRAFMERRDFDVVGVRVDGTVTGFVNRDELGRGSLAPWRHDFDEGRDVVQEHDTITMIFERLAEQPNVFVRMMGQVSGIVTKGDLQKAPARMWLFGLLSLLEMHFLRIIRSRYVDSAWIEMLSKSRVEKACELLAQRAERNEAIDLADCLQFADKARVMAATKELRAAFGFSSRREADRLFNELMALRDQLAHSNDIVSGNWPRLAGLARDAEALLEACERL